MLDQPLMKQALASAFPNAALEGLPKPPSALKLAPTRSPSQGILLRGEEAVIEFSDRAASNGSAVGHVQREILKRAIVETALTGLRHFVTASSLPPGCRDEIQVFAQALGRSETLTISEIRAVVTDVIRSEHDRLQRQKEKLFKKLRETVTSYNVAAETLESRITTASALAGAIMSISLLVDQPGAKPEKSEFRDKRDSNPRAKVVEDLELSVNELAFNPRSLWSRALFDGDFDRADSIARLRETLRSKFRFDGFNAPLPAFLTTDSSNSVQANIDRLLRGSLTGGIGAPLQARFHPESLTNTASYVSQALATTELEKSLRAWTTPDPDPVGLLREDLLTLSQKVPATLIDLRKNLPAELPGPIQDFLKTLCLYRLHGGTEGAAYFASVACHHTPDETRTGLQLRRSLVTAAERGEESEIIAANEKLHHFLAQIPAAHPEDYVSLVGFVAGWPFIPTATDREIGLAPIFGRLNALATSVVYTNTKSLEDSFLRNMSDPNLFDFGTLEQFGHDVAGLAQAAKILGNREVSAYMEPVTESLRNLIEVLKVETLEPRDQLKHFGRVKQAVERQQALTTTLIRPNESTVGIDVTVRAIHERIQPFYQSLTSRLPGYAPELLQTLTDLDQAGEIAEFTRRIAEGAAVVGALESSETSKEIEAVLDKKVISVVNLLGDAWDVDLGIAISELEAPSPLRSELGFSKVSAALSAGTWCSTQLQALREIFSTNTLQNSPVRVNHIDAVILERRRQLSSALIQYPEMIHDYATIAAERIGDATNRNPSMIEAAEKFIDLRLDLRAPKFDAARSAREKLQQVLADIKAESQKPPSEPT